MQDGVNEDGVVHKTKWLLNSEQITDARSSYELGFLSFICLFTPANGITFAETSFSGVNSLILLIPVCPKVLQYLLVMESSQPLYFSSTVKETQAQCIGQPPH